MSTKKMLERVLSARRTAQVGEEGDEDDESKTRKQVLLAMRATNHLTRTGYLLPCLVLGLVVIVVSSLIIHSRDLVCISSPSAFDPVSRMRFFGFDSLESHFGSLGVPWCKWFWILYS
ncbi:unnamed protein product [Ilex paraguariensis]|uniref:Uncharacterized protein n=1 Tax=Ilex paraguariensis TaxID=185542 RepID=A0ABC8U3U8_9AQUA